MKKFFIFFGLIIMANQMFSQNDSIKTVPIIYADWVLGASRDFTDGLRATGGLELNYQFKKNLITFRYLGNSEIKSFFLFIPMVLNKTEEFALMFGKRWIDQGTSYSVSLGLSTNNYSEYGNNNSIISNYNYYGASYEANVRWFKSQKKRYRIYGLIPVGKPTAFGNSFGFKLVGNFSKRSYVGLGLVFGLGYHKKYEQL